MKYQFIAENAIEDQILKSNCAIYPLFDPFVPLLQARSIMVAVKFGIFDALNSASSSAEDLATKLSIEKDCLYFLLRVLTNAGYLNQDKDKFSLTEKTRHTLVSNCPNPLVNWVRYNYIQWDIISKLDEVLEKQHGINSYDLFKTSEDWAINQRAMLETARPAAPMIAEFIPVKNGAKKMLDIGGSHGIYSATLCRKYPPMRSVILELPQAIDHAREIAKEEQIEDIVSYRTGNALTDEFENNFDVIFLGNITHHFTHEQNKQLFQKIKASLTTDGTVALWDFKRSGPDTKPDLIGDGLALFFRITSAAQCYTISDYKFWLESAGFREIIIHPIPAPAQILITGRIS